MPVHLSTCEIRQKFDRLARCYDLAEGVLEWMGLRRLRRQLLRRAQGRVLEVAAGTGVNLAHYPPGCRVTALDLSFEMIHRAQHKARLRRNGGVAEANRLLQADAAALPFRSGRFDAVVSTLSLCTVPEPETVLREMARACVPGGRLLLLEHGRSSHARIARWQDRKADSHARAFACQWNREPLEIVRRAGLAVERSSRHFFGIFHLIEIAL
jgi:ubiquinone/menaquinone biosynthesis C-methylase UbiE